MAKFCGSEFWNSDLTWNIKSNPDFTYCFEETALVWIPCVFLWICSVNDIFKYFNNNNKYSLPWTLYSIAKLILALVLLIISLADLIHSLIKYFNNYSIVYPVEFYTPLIKSITFIYFIILIIIHRKQGIHSSSIIFIFWLLLLIGATFNYRTIFMMIFNTGSYQEKLDNFTYSTKMIYFPVLTAEFLILCFADPTLQKFNHSFHQKKMIPEDSASFLSHLTFWWFNDMIIKGFKRSLTIDDMWQLNNKYLSKEILSNFNKVWNPKVNYEKALVLKQSRQGIPWKTNIGILSSILQTFWVSFLLMGFIKLVASMLTFVNPLILDRLMNYMKPENNEPKWRGFFYASLMFLSPMMESILNSQYEFGINKVSMKSLKLSSNGRKDFTTGEIVNLMSVDTQRIMDYVIMFNVLWSAPLQIGVALYLLWQQLGVATVAGMIIMVLLLPLNGFITAKLRTKQVMLMKQKDKRVKLMNEILNGIKVLKLYAWETSFKDMIMSFRAKEIASFKSMAYLMGFMVFTFSSAPFFVGLASFATYVLIDSNNVLDANKAFVSLSLFNIIRMPMGFLPMVLSMGAMFLVSVRRINKYLNGDEIDDKAIGHQEIIDTPVILENCTFSWDKESEPTLKNISFQIKSKKLVAIVGSVGSGKSSLLSAILGDMEKIKGNVNTFGKIAYVPQQAWIQNSTLRENITFSSDFNQTYYNKVIESCALEPDLKILTAGDLTEIGEKGINLSGGQKQRVSLARAVYANSDIYLLDDPLSAVDAHVGRHLFDNVIGPNGLLKEKTRILITHRISVLPNVDQIIVVKNGCISECGTFDQLIANKGDFAEFIAEYLLDQNHIYSNIDIQELQVIENMAEKLKPILNREMSRTESICSAETNADTTKNSKTRTTSKSGNTVTSASVNGMSQKSGKLIQSETAETGSVKYIVYKKYIQSIGYVFSGCIFLAFICSNGLQVGSSLWLSEWADDALDPNNVNNTKLRDVRLGVYAAFGSAESIFSLFASISLNIACINAAKIIHNNMLANIIRAPMAFFETTPIGRILNRFSKDIDTADSSLVFNLRMMLMQTFRTIVAFAMISIQTAIILAAILPLGIIYYLVQRIYISTSRQLKRIDSTSRSPIYNHFSETVNGTTSIRAYGLCEQFIQQSNEKIDQNNKCYYPSFTATRWLAIRLEFLGYTIVFLAALFAVISRGTLSPGIAGLSISYSLNITAILGMLVRSATDLETNIVSIERCLEYTETPTEGEWVNESTKPSEQWPDKGVIKFDKYSTKYREGLDLVLKNISIEINSCEKVGIVGRTGAGKSSLTLALFRIIEPINGTIIIDGLDITKLGLYDLRSKLTIIPQDPALFTGTLRMNLDPFNKYNDNDIWNALDLSHLKSFVISLDKQLNYEISEGGENLSVGQKQLVCLARALLRKTKVLILDEATAAVDMETDDLIQTTIKNEFKNCTIVTIAHRLNTIIDYNRVIVMDKGMVKEFNTPTALLANNQSIFHSMAKEANII